MAPNTNDGMSLLYTSFYLDEGKILLFGSLSIIIQSAYNMELLYTECSWSALDRIYCLSKSSPENKLVYYLYSVTRFCAFCNGQPGDDFFL
jgi:hypothetical protein